jgi:hypothetical protein
MWSDTHIAQKTVGGSCRLTTLKGAPLLRIPTLYILNFLVQAGATTVEMIEPFVEARERSRLGYSDPHEGRAREGECELGTLAIGKRCQERISATGWAW